MKTNYVLIAMICLFASCSQKQQNSDRSSSSEEAMIQEELIEGLDSIFVKYAATVGDSTAVSYILGNDDGYCAWHSTEYIPKKSTMDAIINYVPAKSLIYHQVVKEHTLKSAIWLFIIHPNVVIDRLSQNNTWYSPEIRGEIKRKLIEYYDESMGEKIAIKVADITPDKTLTDYMGGKMESTIHSVNPSRITKIYSCMTAFQISSYAETPSEIFKKIGKQSYLNTNLHRANCNDLAHLKTSGVISSKEFAKFFKKRPEKEQSSFDPSIWESGD